MKKLIILLLCFVVNHSTKEVSANSNYDTYSQFLMQEGKLIDDYKEEEISSYYDIVDDRKMFGWRAEIINEKVNVTYTVEEIFNYSNDGFETIDFDFQYDEKYTKTRKLSVVGDMKLKESAKQKGFSAGLERKIESSLSVEDELELTYKSKMKIPVAPGSRAVMSISGEGRITNGVGASYFLWFRSNRGGYEEFVVTNQYYNLEVSRI